MSHSSDTINDVAIRGSGKLSADFVRITWNSTVKGAAKKHTVTKQHIYPRKKKI